MKNFSTSFSEILPKIAGLQLWDTFSSFHQWHSGVIMVALEISVSPWVLW